MLLACQQNPDDGDAEEDQHNGIPPSGSNGDLCHCIVPGNEIHLGKLDLN